MPRRSPAKGACEVSIAAASLPVQQGLTDPTSSIFPTAIVILGILGIPLGVLAGFLGARFAIMLHALAPVTRQAR